MEPKISAPELVYNHSGDPWPQDGAGRAAKSKALTSLLKDVWNASKGSAPKRDSLLSSLVKKCGTRSVLLNEELALKAETRKEIVDNIAAALEYNRKHNCAKAVSERGIVFSMAASPPSDKGDRTGSQAAIAEMLGTSRSAPIFTKS